MLTQTIHTWVNLLEMIIKLITYLRIGVCNLYYLKFASSVKSFYSLFSFSFFLPSFLYFSFFLFLLFILFNAEVIDKAVNISLQICVIDLDNATGLAQGRLSYMDILWPQQKWAVIMLCVHSLLWQLIILGNCVNNMFPLR